MQIVDYFINYSLHRCALKDFHLHQFIQNALLPYLLNYCMQSANSWYLDNQCHQCGCIKQLYLANACIHPYLAWKEAIFILRSLKCLIFILCLYHLNLSCRKAVPWNSRFFAAEALLLHLLNKLNLYKDHLSCLYLWVLFSLSNKISILTVDYHYIFPKLWIIQQSLILLPWMQRSNSRPIYTYMACNCHLLLFKSFDWCMQILLLLRCMFSCQTCLFFYTIITFFHCVFLRNVFLFHDLKLLSFFLLCTHKEV